MSFKDLSSKTDTPMKPLPPKNDGLEAKKEAGDSASRSAKEEKSE